MKLQKNLSVTCKKPIEAYYSNYGGNKQCFFTPEDIGVIIEIGVPSVTRENKVFNCIDFEKYGQNWRVALTNDNIVILNR